jgi:hypothetical protein
MSAFSPNGAGQKDRTPARELETRMFYGSLFK